MSSSPPPRARASEDEIRLDRLRRRRRSYPFRRLVRANLHDLAALLRRSRLSLLFLALVLAAGTAYLALSYFPARCEPGAPCPLDPTLALYEALKLLIFQSGLDFPSDALGRALFFALPLLGLFFLLQSVIDFARLVFDKGARRESWQVALASTFSDHVLVCGVGRVGYRTVLQLLDAGYPVVAVDVDGASEFVATMLRLKVPLIVGDARDPDVLRSAGVARSRGLIAAIDDDLKNIEIALAARRLQPTLQTVLRIYNRELDVNLERSFGRNSAFSSSALAAPTFAAAAVSREIVHVLGLPAGLLGLSELTVAPDSEAAGFVRAVEERYAVRLIRLRDSGGRDRPGFTGRLEPGDVALFLGSLEALEQLRAANLAGSKLDFLRPLPQQRPSERLNTVIVCGLGKVGTAVVQLLLRAKPRPVLVVICTADTPADSLAPLVAQGVKVIRGDARDPDTLKRAGIERAYAVAAVFGNDLTNLQIGLSARNLRPDVHLVLRVFSDVLAERLAALFGINTAYSTSSLAAPTLAAAAVLRGVDHGLDVGERLFASESRTVAEGDPLVGCTVAELRERTRLLALGLRRGATQQLIPPYDLCLAVGDELVLLGDLRDLARLRAQGERV